MRLLFRCTKFRSHNILEGKIENFLRHSSEIINFTRGRNYFSRQRESKNFDNRWYSYLLCASLSDMPGDLIYSEETRKLQGAL
jgi:hypothetical protein